MNRIIVIDIKKIFHNQKLNICKAKVKAMELQHLLQPYQTTIYCKYIKDSCTGIVKDSSVWTVRIFLKVKWGQFLKFSEKISGTSVRTVLQVEWGMCTWHSCGVWTYTITIFSGPVIMPLYSCFNVTLSM